MQSPGPAGGLDETGAAPGRGRRRVLLEAPDPALARRCARRLRREGFSVATCAGDGPGGRGCPLLAGGTCPLVERADVVLHALPGDPGRAVLRELTRTGRPVLVLGTGGTGAALGGADLVEATRRTLAGRARRLRDEVRLRDGRPVCIRAIEAGDAEPLRAFDGSLSEESRRLRYLGWMPPLSAERATAMAAVDFRDRFALVAIAPGDPPLLVGDCRLAPVPGAPGRAEVAIAVADDYRDAGLGRALLERMLRIAGDRGCQMVADVRYDNARMMHLLRTLGFRRTAWELGVATFVHDPG